MIPGIHISLVGQVIVVYDGQKPIGHIGMKNGKAVLMWDTGSGTPEYEFHELELPYTDLWNDITLEVARELADKYLLGNRKQLTFEF